MTDTHSVDLSALPLAEEIKEEKVTEVHSPHPELPSEKMEDIPSTQVLDDLGALQLFRNTDGTQWQIFVEAGGILSRPKLVRTLKKVGAVVCTDPKYAQVILVNSNSRQGRLFIRDWGQDKNKVVLEYGWAFKCIAAQRVLKESDEWGGCLTHDDGLPIADEEKAETDDIPNPLPTPRITPVEIRTSSHLHNSVAKPPTETRTCHTPTTEIYQTPALTKTQIGPSYSDLGATTATSQYPQYPQYSQSPHFPLNVMPQFSQQPSIQQFSQPQLTMQQFSQFQHSGMMPLQSGPNDMAQQAIVNFVAQQLNPQYRNPTDPFTMALLDAMRAHGVTSGPGPWPIPPGQNGQPPFPNSSIRSTAGQSSHASSTMLGSNFNLGMVSSQSAPQVSPVNLPSSSSAVIPPSLRRRSPKPSPVLSSISKSPKDKRRAVSPSPRSWKHASHTSSLPSLDKASTSPGPTTQSGKIFTSETGSELSFFVQIDLKDRFALVNTIKKNGGKITNNQASADYAILYSRSKTFDHLLQSTVAANRPAVVAAFVQESLAKNQLLDHTPFLIEVDKRWRKKFLANGTNGKVETKKRGRLSLQEEAKKKVKREDSQREDTTMADGRPRPRSPTPPSEHTRVQYNDGRFGYPDIEREYAIRYITVLLQRDYSMSANAIAQHLYRKMRHHTLSSWRTYIRQMARDEVADIRKRMSIAYRKADSTQPSHQQELKQKQEDDEPEKLLQSVTSSPSPMQGLSFEDQEALHRKLQEEDLEVISHFFATGGGDDPSEDDARIWARLTSQVKCNTADNWEEFYNQHHVAVNDRYTKLTNPVPLDKTT